MGLCSPGRRGGEFRRIDRVVMRMKTSQREWCLKSIPIQELSEIFDHIGRAKDKMLEVYPYLERTSTVCQGLEKMFALCQKLCNTKEESPVQRTYRKHLNTE